MAHIRKAPQLIELTYGLGYQTSVEATDFEVDHEPTGTNVNFDLTCNQTSRSGSNSKDDIDKLLEKPTSLTNLTITDKQSIAGIVSDRGWRGGIPVTLRLKFNNGVEHSYQVKVSAGEWRVSFDVVTLNEAGTE